MKVFCPGNGCGRRSIARRCTSILMSCGIAIVVFLLLATRPLSAQSTGPDALIDHLNSAISWYRHLSESADMGAASPSNGLHLQNARAQALQALQFAFQSAQEEAVLIQKQSDAPSDSVSPQVAQGRVGKAGGRVASRIAQTRSRIEALNRDIRAATGKRRKDLVGQRERLQGQLKLDTILQERFSKMAGFMTGNDHTGLAGKIEALKASVPELAPAGPAAKTTAQPVSRSDRTYSSGLIGQTGILLGRMGDIRVADDLLSETARLRSIVEGLQKPLRESMRAIMRQGREPAGPEGTGGEPSGPKGTAREPSEPKVTAREQAGSKGTGQGPAAKEGTGRESLEGMIERFRQLSAASLPLRQEIVLLDQVRSSLLEARKSLEKEYSSVLRSIVTRVVVILATLFIVLLCSEIWRRTTFRYVREVRRRRQVLLIRRFVTGFALAIVVILGFVTEFSSLATFAGFLTAGIAVALQTVILSVAAYFFLIGRYGVRVGDRITVSGVTGDVIHIGLVRMHLLELSGTGVNLYPTGRVVVFSNSVLLQASPLFKQIPGTAYTWHEAVVGLARGTDRTGAQEKLLEAVNGVYERYRDEIEKQHRAVEHIIEAEVPAPVPHGEVHFTDGGLEFVARYPVEIRRAQEIDDQVTKGLMETIEGDSVLKAAVSSPPKLRSVIKG